MPATAISDSSDVILGQEFLTWLWHQSDIAPQSFVHQDGESFSVSLEQRIVVEGGAGESRETASVSGAVSPLREARFGLRTGKKVSRALIRFEKGPLNFQFSLNAGDFSISGLKTPKLDKEDKDDEPDALLLEKIYLIESCLSLLDGLYARFLNLRLGPKWQQTVGEIQAWLNEQA